MSNAIDRRDWKAVTKIHAATSERHRESDGQRQDHLAAGGLGETM